MNLTAPSQVTFILAVFLAALALGSLRPRSDTGGHQPQL